MWDGLDSLCLDMTLYSCDALPIFVFRGLIRQLLARLASLMECSCHMLCASLTTYHCYFCDVLCCCGPQRTLGHSGAGL